MTISPLAPASFPVVPMISGVRFATVEAGVRYSGRKDVMLAHLQAGTSIAGVFTTSATRAAPVLDCQAKLGGDPSGEAAIIVNSGNANAFTGSGGAEAVTKVCTAVANTLGIDAQRVFSSSTGVIGEALPFEKITVTLSDLKKGLSPGELKGAAEAIMTTDTFPKAAGAQINIDGKYGFGLNLNEIVNLSLDDYNEQIYSKYLSNFDTKYSGLHHIHYNKNFSVFDLCKK